MNLDGLQSLDIEYSRELTSKSNQIQLRMKVRVRDKNANTTEISPDMYVNIYNRI